MRISELFDPRRQNTVQRLGFACAAIYIIVALFLQNPVSGYEVEKTVQRGQLQMTKECPGERFMQLAEKGNSKTPEEYAEVNRLNWICWRQDVTYSKETAPFEEWRSLSPMLPWFASVSNVVWSIALALGVSLVWILVFRKPPESPTN